MSKVRNSVLDEIGIQYGVHQRIVLEPLFLIILINDI